MSQTGVTPAVGEAPGSLLERVGPEIERTLLPLPPAEFRETAERLLDQAETLLRLDEPELAASISEAVSRTAKNWAQRHGTLGVYSERLSERAKDFARFLDPERR